MQTTDPWQLEDGGKTRLSGSDTTDVTFVTITHRDKTNLYHKCERGTSILIAVRRLKFGPCDDLRTYRSTAFVLEVI